MEDSILFFFFNLSFFSKYNGLISPLNGSSFFLFFFREIVVLSQWSTSALKFSHISLRKETRTQGCEIRERYGEKRGNLGEMEKGFLQLVCTG